MAGTDHGAGEGWTGPAPAVILVRPQMGENIGAAARGMWNFGLDRLRLVAPRDGWPNSKAVAMASGAGRVLDHVGLFDDTAGAVADLNFVYATTARDRDLTKPVLTPEEAMADAAGRIAQGQKVGVLFGPERAGLENDDIVQASAIISVPVNPAFASLNLAQCVLLMAYEWRQASGAPHPDRSTQQARPAERIEVEKLMERLEGSLDAAGFFYPDHKAAPMRRNLRNLFSRLDLTEPDIRILHGVIKTLASGRVGD